MVGSIARCIVSQLSPGQAVKLRARFGVIAFGSRLDVYLPPSQRLLWVLGSGWWPVRRRELTAPSVAIAASPAIAPLFGAILGGFLGWRTVFWLMACFGLGVLLSSR
ncbi:MAG: phosphatidylserine decarboxylase [Pseudomonadota bacterium]